MLAVFLVRGIFQRGHAEPVGVDPPAVGISGGLLSHKAHASPHPLALAHGERIAHGGEAAAVAAVGKLQTAVADVHAHVDVFVDGKLVVGLVPPGRGERGKRADGLRLALVGVVAGDLPQLEAVGHAPDDERRVVEAHHDEASHLPLGLAHELEPGRGCEAVGRRLLEQQAGRVPERQVALVGVEAEKAQCGGHAESGVVVGLPLPLGRKARLVELIALRRVGYRVGGSLGHAVCEAGCAAIATGWHAAHDGPVVAPGHGLQVHHAAVGPLVLEVQEPVFAVFRVHPRALMGPVDGAVALGQHLAHLVGAEGRAGAHGQLEARGHAAGRTHNPIPAVALVEFGALAGVVLGAVAVEHDDGPADGAGALDVELAHGDDRGEAAAAVGPRVDEVAAAVVVPERRSVDDAFAGDDQHGWLPGTGRMGGLDHEDAVVGVAPVDVEPAVVVADAGRPHAVAVLGAAGVHAVGQHAVEGMADDFPVDQVAGMEHRQSGRAAEGARREVIVVAHGHHVRVAVVGVDDGIGVGAVAVVGAPHLRAVLRRGAKGQHGQQQRAQNVFGVHGEGFSS